METVIFPECTHQDQVVLRKSKRTSSSYHVISFIVGLARVRYGRLWALEYRMGR